MVTYLVGLCQGIGKESPHGIFVQANHVVTVQEGVLHQFPVAVDGSHLLLAEVITRHIEQRQVLVQSRQVSVQIHVPTCLHPHQAAINLGGQRYQAEFLYIEAVEAFLARDIAQRAVQAVCPLVIGADQGAQAGLPFLLHQAHTAVAAYVHKGSYGSGLVAHRD